MGKDWRPPVDLPKEAETEWYEVKGLFERYIVTFETALSIERQLDHLRSRAGSSSGTSSVRAPASRQTVSGGSWKARPRRASWSARSTKCARRRTTMMTIADNVL
jgi:hypothetical protein